MGINGLFQYLKKEHGEVFRNEHISYFAYKRVFIDISGLMYRYICVYGTGFPSEGGLSKHRVWGGFPTWVNVIIDLINLLKENKVVPYVIFDGKSPIEKQDEAINRKKQKDKHVLKVTTLKTALTNVKNLKPSAEDINILKADLEILAKKGKIFVSYLRPAKQGIISKADIEALEEHIRCLEKQFISIKDTDISALKTAFDQNCIPYIVAPAESEGVCCSFIKRGDGCAVISNDSDCLVHGATLILDLDLSGKCNIVEIDDVLEVLEITQKQLIDCGILMGCDYNRHIKDNVIGPVNTFKIIKKYGSIENIPDEKIKKDNLLVEVCRSMFNVSLENIDLNWNPACGGVDAMKNGDTIFVYEEE